MATGLGARKSNADQKYFTGTAQHDGYVTGGVSAGPTMVKFPGMGSNGENAYNLDATSMWVWGLTLGAIAVVLGVHFTFGGHRLL
jgi:hypothetical protein